MIVELQNHVLTQWTITFVPKFMASIRMSRPQTQDRISIDENESQRQAADDPADAPLASYSRARPILMVISSFVLTLTACGLNFAFGVYQELYESLDGPFADASPAQIDLIGTLGVSLMTILAPYASAWTKSYSPRTMTLIGAVLFALANILASVSQTYGSSSSPRGFCLGVPHV